MGRKKTYVSASMSNLNSDQEEWRYAQLAVFNASLNKLNYSGVFSMNDQRANSGVNHRNYILWARDYKYTQYNDPDYAYDQTYDQMIGMQSPTISIEVNVTQEQADQILKEKFNFEPGEKTLTGQTVTLPAVDINGNETQVTITTNIVRKSYYKVGVSYIGGYDHDKLARAYIYEKGDKYLDKWLDYGIITGEEFVQIANGNGASDVDYDEDEVEDEVTEGESTNLEGNMNDAWLFFGYNVTEHHIDEETNEEVNEIVFQEEEQEYIELEKWVNSKVPNNNADTVYYIFAGYIYYEDIIDAYEMADSKVRLDTSGQPIPIEGQTMPLLHHYEWELEDYQNTWTEERDSRINLEDIEFFCLVLDNNDALNDSLLGQTTEKVKNEDLLMSPPLAFKLDKSWIPNNENHYWYKVNKKAAKKETGDKDFYAETNKSVQESVTDKYVAWVYLMYGIPVNMCQLAYCARYGLQFFKMLCFSNWRNITPGMVTDQSCGGRSWTVHAHAYNYHYHFYLSGCTFRTGIGSCPAPGYLNVRSGEAGVANYGGGAALWSQTGDNTWEMVIVRGYGAEFQSIKNGKSSSPGGAGWWDAIWEKVDVKRNYSKCLIPVSKTVFAEIPIADWTDCTQYMRNFGVTAYKVVKKKWYQTGLFKFIMVIIIIVITIIVSIYSGGTGGVIVGGVGSILGTVANALWLIIKAVAISYAVGYVVNFLLNPILTEVFGAIIANVLCTAMTIVISSYCMGVGFNSAEMLQQFTYPQNWLSLIDSAIQGYNKVLQNKMKEMTADYQKTMEAIKAAQEDVYSAYAQYLNGNNQNVLTQLTTRFDAPLGALTDNCVIEQPSFFLERTMFTGSEIAEHCFENVEYFCDNLLDLRQSIAIAV